MAELDGVWTTPRHTEAHPPYVLLEELRRLVEHMDGIDGPFRLDTFTVQHRGVEWTWIRHEDQ